jgi:hypothetical protein
MSERFLGLPQVPNYCGEQMEWNGDGVSFTEPYSSSEEEGMTDKEFVLEYLRSHWVWFDRLCYKLEAEPNFRFFSLHDPDESNGVICPIAVIEWQLRQWDEFKRTRTN